MQVKAAEASSSPSPPSSREILTRLTRAKRFRSLSTLSSSRAYHIRIPHMMVDKRGHRAIRKILLNIKYKSAVLTCTRTRYKFPQKCRRKCETPCRNIAKISLTPWWGRERERERGRSLGGRATMMTMLLLGAPRWGLSIRIKVV